MESAGFMNALTSAASAAPVVRKRKRASTAAKVHVVSCFLSGHFKNVIFFCILWIPSSVCQSVYDRISIIL